MTKITSSTASSKKQKDPVKAAEERAAMLNSRSYPTPATAADGSGEAVARRRVAATESPPATPQTKEARTRKKNGTKNNLDSTDDGRRRERAGNCGCC